jgi:hypothetical protein
MSKTSAVAARNTSPGSPCGQPDCRCRRALHSRASEGASGLTPIRYHQRASVFQNPYPNVCVQKQLHCSEASHPSGNPATSCLHSVLGAVCRPLAPPVASHERARRTAQLRQYRQTGGLELRNGHLRHMSTVHYSRRLWSTRVNQPVRRPKPLLLQAGCA